MYWGIPNELNQQCKTRSNNNSITFPGHPSLPLVPDQLHTFRHLFANRKTHRRIGALVVVYQNILFAKSSHKTTENALVFLCCLHHQSERCLNESDWREVLFASTFLDCPPPRLWLSWEIHREFNQANCDLKLNTKWRKQNSLREFLLSIFAYSVCHRGSLLDCFLPNLNQKSCPDTVTVRSTRGPVSTRMHF